MSERSDFEWLVLDHAGAIQHLGVAYGLARKLFPEKDANEINELVRDTLLHLLDDGLILFFRSTWDNGFSEDPSNVDHLPRERIVNELESGYWVTDSDDFAIFFIETQKGAAVFAGLPAEVVERIRGRESSHA
jgi:hypothetical protein